ncbi:MAG: nuclear transport factor 2 family protein [Deltaproteobacteria bacterium]|nr:nuclear transport factor 2 family protein [Deltaproteobacteria bacterium]
MTTRDIIQNYFDSLKQKSGWKAFLADEMTFTSFVSPIKRVAGKGAYLEATKRFFSMITAVEVKNLIVDGDRACALTRYELQPPGGPVFDSHVAEVFEVRDGKIASLDIYFDSTPFPKPPTAA